MPILRLKDTFQTKRINYKSHSKMKYESHITVKDPNKELYALFEKYSETQDRSEVKVTHEKDCLIVSVTAKDSVALRASLNGVTKLFTVYEKMSKL